MYVKERKRERKCVFVKKRMVYVRERKRETVYVCERERERV